MALSATFTANFASFYDAVDKADAKLKDFGAGADKVGGRLNAMANQFSGVKIIQDATLMAKAVEEIGGVTKLTEKELAKLGGTANEAVAKMKALGMDVPKNLQLIADKTKDANKSTTDWMGTLTKIAATMGIAFSISTITNFIGSIFDAADAIGDLADQWGFSITAVQKWTKAANASGVETQTLGKSIQFFTQQLGEGSEAYQALLANVGLSYDALRKMPLEEAYKLVLKAIGGIKDEALQLDVAQGLLGDSSKKMIGAIKTGLAEATDAQKVMSEQTILRLKEAQAEWKKFKDNVVTYSGEMLAEVTKNAKLTTSSWKNFLTMVSMGPMQGTAFIDAQKNLEHYRESVGKTGKDIVLLDEHQTDLNKTVKSSAQVAADLKKRQEALAKAAADQAKAAKVAEDAQEKYNKSLDDAVDTFSGRGLIDKAFLYVEALKHAIPVAQMTKTQQANINRVMLDAIEVYEAAGQSAPNALYDLYLATRQLAEETDELRESLPTGDWIKPGSIDLGKAFTLDTVPIENQLDKLQIEMNEAIAALGGGPAPAEQLETLDQSVARLGKSFAQLAEISGGAFGEIGGQIATTIGAMDVVGQSTETFKKGLVSFKGGAVTQGLAQTAAAGLAIAAAFASATQDANRFEGALQGAAMGASIGGKFGVYGAAIGAMAGYLRGVYNEAKNVRALLDARWGFIDQAGGLEVLTVKTQEATGSLKLLQDVMTAQSAGALEAAVRKLTDALQADEMRDAFVEAQGGVEDLTKAAELAGTTVEDLFAAKDTAAVTKSIKDIEDALKFQADAYDLAVETAEKYGFTIEELGPAMARQELDKKAQGLYQDWEVLNSAGLDTVNITDKMSKAVSEYYQRASKMGLEIPAEMRPMLESFAKAGKLLDENGDEIKDLEADGAKFSLTMSEGFQKLIDKVADLTDAISRSLGLAIKDIPDIDVKGTVRVDTVVNPPSQPHGEAPPEFQQGTGGFRNFGKGTPVILHGWEAVVPRGDAGAFATVSGTGGGAPAAAVPTIVINAQGAFFDTPESLQRLATKVSDALTAKYSVMGKLRAAV